MVTRALLWLSRCFAVITSAALLLKFVFAVIVITYKCDVIFIVVYECDYQRIGNK